MNNDDPMVPKKREVVLGEDLYEFSVSDIDERVGELELEIVRLKEERAARPVLPCTAGAALCRCD
jgi:uncharacterized small protein (DUF1192 family)